MRSPRSVVERLVAPWRRAPCGAGVLGPQVEAIDQRLTGCEAGQRALDDAVAALGAEVQVHADLPAVVGEAMTHVLTRLEQLEAELLRREPVGPDDAV
jgi:hypothetical protein